MSNHSQSYSHTFKTQSSILLDSNWNNRWSRTLVQLGEVCGIDDLGLVRLLYLFGRHRGLLYNNI